MTMLPSGDLVALTAALVDIASVSHEEQAIVAVLEAELRSLDHLETVRIGDAPGTTRERRSFPMQLDGEILYRAGKQDAGFERLREAVRHEDALRYDEPPDWIQPVRHALGAALLQSGRFTEAETVFRADLEKLPGNGWSLFGLGRVAVDDVHHVLSRVPVSQPGAAPYLDERGKTRPHDTGLRLRQRPSVDHGV